MILVQRDVFVGFCGAEWPHTVKVSSHMSPRGTTLTAVVAIDGIRIRWPDHLFPELSREDTIRCSTALAKRVHGNLLVLFSSMLEKLVIRNASYVF